MAAPESGGDGGGSANNGGRTVRNLAVTAITLLGSALIIRKLTKNSTQWDHVRRVADALTGEKFSSEQAAEDPQTYFDLRYHACPAAELADRARVLYVEQAFRRTPDKPYRQRFLKVKPCPKELKCDCEVSAYAVRDPDEYRNFCDRPKNQRPQPDEVVGDIAEHLTTVHLSQCGEQPCLYKGSTPPEGFPNSWNGAATCTSELGIYRDGEIHSWDRGYNEEGAQVWGLEKGPYHFKAGSGSGERALPF